jgi:hypothetical protein
MSSHNPKGERLEHSDLISFKVSKDRICAHSSTCNIEDNKYHKSYGCTIFERERWLSSADSIENDSADLVRLEAGRSPRKVVIKVREEQTKLFLSSPIGLAL